MNKYFLALAATMLLISCGSDGNFKITGTTPDINNGTYVYLQKIDINNQILNVDTTVIKDGKFSFTEDPVENSELMALSFQKIRGNVFFISENEEISIKAYKDSLYTSEVDGGVENDVFKLYYDDVVTSNNEKQRLQQEGMAAMQNGDTAKVNIIRNEFEQINEADTRRRIKLIKDHPDRFISIISLSELVGTRAIESSEAEELFENLDASLKETKKGKRLNEMIAKLKSQEAAAAQAEIGNKAPAFTAPTPEGEELALADAMGSKYTIIDFWASWCKPCRQENPNVVSVYNTYHDKGLNIISVSLDRASAKDKWLAAIENDKMDWFHVSNLMEWQDPVARKYGVTAIPATYLIDAEGVIIDKNLRGEALVAKMQELLGEG
ncbi:TlpA disulfide reductase family protein [Leeuwenhoekiella blandensis]|uniref:Putative lipoprotein/thioderoxin n=1 Tax=Leeuwenhoekiella blandensis (strain CECT 7118 / CCUG 51940 / KCTC 22103 / MED217) TaxID=398720 RepID=A3XLM7_LEEBM|nr:TlpA disulfide reductase family protein [Leeuwenhoekiella blandensis]EAQ49541.1 putative lipoprotein/thioderoxin [Leeuwenhoekiella blandensis MED217]